MAWIYRLAVDDVDIGDIYYNECDAVESATQISIDTGEIVTVWGAEEVEGVSVDALEGSIIRVVWA